MRTLSEVVTAYDEFDARWKGTHPRDCSSCKFWRADAPGCPVGKCKLESSPIAREMFVSYGYGCGTVLHATAYGEYCSAWSAPDWLIDMGCRILSRRESLEYDLDWIRTMALARQQAAEWDKEFVAEHGVLCGDGVRRVP